MSPEPWRLSSAVAWKIAKSEVGMVVHREMFQVVDQVGQETIFNRVGSPSLFYRVRLTDIRGGIVVCPPVHKVVTAVWKEKN